MNAIELKKLLNYDPETGDFYWLKNLKLAGTIRKDGYRQISIEGKFYLAHRLAWLYVIGSFPKYFLDHINLNRSNNSFSNLREATNSENLANADKPKNNTSGYKGIRFVHEKQKWVARIMKNRKAIHIGYFEKLDEAIAAYKKYAKQLLGEFYRVQI